MKYDAVVIGAGPAGSTAAFEIACAGYSVLLVEKREKPGSPVYCAEAVSRPAFEKLLDPRREWICSRIENIRVVGPRGKELNIFHRDAGYILDREKLDYDLAARAVEAGCTLECRTIGVQLAGRDGLFESIELLKPSGQRTRVKASVFVAADGVESRIARVAGLNNRIEFDEIESLLQYRLEGISVDPACAEFYPGNEVAPGGYVWVFPKSSGSANVGIGVTIPSKRSEPLATLLDDFIKRRFGGGTVSRRTCGMVPKYQGKKTFRLANLLVAGDAARTLDSLTGAGIVNAVMSGKYAAQAAAAYLSGGMKDVDQLSRLYPRKFLEVKGEELSMYLKLRNVYRNLNDDDFDDIIVALNEYFGRNSVYGINAGKLLAGLIRTRPRLLRLVRYLI